jgi:hypothetical protein
MPGPIFEQKPFESLFRNNPKLIKLSLSDTYIDDN